MNAPTCIQCGRPLPVIRRWPDRNSERGVSYGTKEWRDLVRSQPIEGYGYNGRGHFCTLRCGWRWAIDRLEHR